MNKYNSNRTKQLTSKTADELTKLKASVSILWRRVLKAAKTKAADIYTRIKRKRIKNLSFRQMTTQKTRPTANMWHALEQLATKKG